METQTLDPQFSPNKRPKIVSQTINPPISPSSDKGKAPICDDDGDSDGYESPVDLPPQNCGVCFSEEGKSVRGLIDSCNHYFCFLCIIEWSKIESRCPLCRSRFSTIRRMRKDGTFIGDGSVRVPVRDQIYDPYEEPTDPYAQARCSVCNGTTDESLLLLCDLCDSALHTYCVGLGVTVPEGDWYCQDCALLRAEQYDSEMNDNVTNSDDNVDISTTSKQLDEESSTVASVSIFDIVRDPSPPTKCDRGVDRLRKLVSPTKRFSSPMIVSGQANRAHKEGLESSGCNLKPQIDVEESSARTLRNCRNVRKHINVLRDNWDALRNGSLRFSSDLSGPSRKNGRKINVVQKDAEKSCQSHSSSTPSSFQSKALDTSSNAFCSKNPYDVDKAWKLMKIAKSMQHLSKPKCASKAASGKEFAGKTNNVAAKFAPFGRKDVISCVSKMQSPHDKVSGRLPQRLGKHQFPIVVHEAASTSSSTYQNFPTSKLSLSRNVQTPLCYADKVGSPSWRKLGREPPTSFDDGFACSTSSSMPTAETSDVSCTKLHKKGIPTHPCEQVRSASNCSTSMVGSTKNICSTSCRPIEGTSDISCTKLHNREMLCSPHKQVRDADNCSTSEVGVSAQADICNDTASFLSVQKIGAGLSNVSDENKGAACSHGHGPVKGASDTSHGKLHQAEVSARPSEVGSKISNKISKNDEAKSEIQSLVKLNLKLLSKDKQLGADAFKDIARLSTHTILAACGFEHRKIVRPCPTLVCNHCDQIQQRFKSTLMPSSCRECFYLFVKNVVNSIMSEKLDSSSSAVA